MRFLLYNIRYATFAKKPKMAWNGYARNTNIQLDRIIEFIRPLAPDIIGLVEVDFGSFRTKNCHQVEKMAESLGHYHSYESKYCGSTRISSLPVFNKQGNAFLAKDTITNERFHYFNKGFKRLVIELELENLTIFLVHLALGFKTRHQQLAELYSLVKETKGPYIVAGDFNALWGEHEIELFLGATGLINANSESIPTFPSWAPKRHLDFVLHSPEVEVTRFWVPDVQLSDHLPMVLDFNLPDSEEP